ncbi:MAG: hypothetical protein R3230_01475 [Nitrosopumilaceae archaeon]|nr:hypothetical protein [Nitrosopumilaceae archaeon]
MAIPIPLIIAGLQAAPHVIGGLKGLYNWWQGPNQAQQQQQQLQQGYGQAGLDLLQQLGQPMQGQVPNVNLAPLNIGALQQQARQQFQQQTVPALAERFTAGGGGRSSAFNRQLAGAAGNLESELAALGPAFEQQRRGQLLQQRGQNIQGELGRLGQLRGVLGDRAQTQLAQQRLALSGRQAQQGALGALGNLFQAGQQGRIGQGRNVNQLLGMLGNIQGGFPNALIPQGYFGG